MAAGQERLIANLSGYLKRGGRLVYAACTLEPEETNSVIKGFLKGRTDFVLEDAGEFLPGGPGALVDGEGFLRTYPHRHGTDAFFAARLKRP